MMIQAFLLANLMVAGLPSWEFDDARAINAWVPNGHFDDVTVRDGTVTARATDWDPFFSCDGLEFPATPWQYVVVRLKADDPGMGELFWSGQTTGKYGGLSPNKKTAFQVKGGNVWQEIVLFPFWQGEKTIRKMRLDLYHGVTCSIDSIRVASWADPRSDPLVTTSWTFAEGDEQWKRHPDSDTRMSPPLRINVDKFRWVGVRVASRHEGAGSLLWAGRDSRGAQARGFLISEEPATRYYNIDMKGVASWSGEIAVLGVRLPPTARLEGITLADKPSGPARLELVSFGVASGVNRVGKSAELQLHVQNTGGHEFPAAEVELKLGEGLHLVGRSSAATLPRVPLGQRAMVSWAVRADRPGRFEIEAAVEGQLSVRKKVRIDPAVNLPVAKYVPPPHGVATDVEICAYYFPGFDSDKKWVPIRDTAPIRKPLLGWYDEGNPECVDWQIKWARENGISAFFVDWYWVAGRQQLTHWFEAYRKARYRDQLQVAIMWANHNPPNTHSVRDWDRVTREWLDRYFNLPAYYRINDKPVVMIWDPRRLREDLAQEAARNDPGTSPDSAELVRNALEHARELAKAAGHKGITFVAIQHSPSASQSKVLASEGYDSVTSYHEWGKAPELGISPQRMRFDDVVTTARKHWEEWNTAAGRLDYYPVVDTGWDSRPWHGAKARVIRGRTADKFEQLLRSAKSYAREHDCPRIVLGPVNEWGEGSYVEPCAEFGFDMIERVRNVFGRGDPASWPTNIGPSDVGLGPYEYPKMP